MNFKLITSYLPITISIVGLFFSFLTFYFSYLKKAAIKVSFGNSLRLFYNDYKEEKHSFGIYLPIDFINTSNNTGVIEKVSILLYKINQKSEKYYIESRHYSKFDVEKNRWQFDELAHSIVIGPKTSLYKTILFSWHSLSVPNIILEKGDYEIKLIYWTDSSKKPLSKILSFNLNDSLFNKLNNKYSNRITTTVEVPVNKKYEKNRLLSEFEEKQLFN
jgi:hypothetical protein